MVFLGPIVILRRTLSPFDPSLLIAFLVFVGCSLGSYYIAFGEGPRHYVVTNGEPVAFFITGGAAAALGLFLTAVANAVIRGRLPVERLFASLEISSTRLVVGLFFFSSLSILGLAVYVARTGVLFSESISAKRSLTVETDYGETIHAGLGYITELSQLSSTVALITVAAVLSRQIKIGKLGTIALLFAFSAPLVQAFVSSSRGTLLHTLISVALIYSLYRGFSARIWISLALSGLIVFTIMAELRSDAHGAKRDDNGVLMLSAITKLSESGNGFSLAGTAHILQHVPQRLDYQFGTTYLTWLTAPIPRVFWPDKPEVSLGKRIKEDILRRGVVRTGRPPSFLTEGYINFGVVGFVLSAVAFGVGLRILSNSFVPLLLLNPYVPAFYLGITLALIKLVNGNFSQAMIALILHISTFALIVSVVGGIKSNKRIRGLLRSAETCETGMRTPR